ncbi:MAG TPA: AMP-binding protein [Vicinamibacterales bacterium]|nr:AMP-binding protein [Vicinamibacterales bacterium]
MKTLVDVFRTLETRRGEFIVYDDGYRVRRHSYAEVTRAARGFAARLVAHGVGKGDKVLLWGENRPEWIACYWGIQLAGAIAVPIDFRSSPAFADRIRAIVAAKVVLAGDDATDWHQLDAGSGCPTWKLADLDWDADGPVPDVAIDRDDVAQIVFTSGATAEPKGVVIRHRNILANVIPVAKEIDKYKKYAKPFQPIRFLNLLPLSHLFGQSMATNIPPLIDGTVVFMRSFNPHDIVRRVREWRISVIVCVPKILDVLKEHALRVDPAAADPPTGLSIPARWWRYRKIHRMFGLKFWAFIVGAAPLGSSLEDFWKRLGFVVIQGYGLTETAPIVTLNHPFKTNTGSVGTAIGGVEIKIAEDGEILVRGENVSSGYYGEESSAVAGSAGVGGTAGRTLDEAGWLHTGDIGEKDANGRLFIKGRKKEMIVTPEGLNVFPDDVEREINQQPGVVESAVVGDDRVHAVLVLQPGVDPEHVVRDANARLADHQRIRSFSLWTVGPLPRTEGTRKLKRAAIKQWVASGAQPVAASAGDPLQALLTKFAGSRSLDGTTSIEGLGLSSLERVELMVALEDQFQTRIDETKFASAKTLDDLRSVVTAPPQEADVPEPVDFPTWNRAWPVRVIRRASLFSWILPIARLFAWVRVQGLEHLDHVTGPVVFAANHQSHMDVPVILSVLPGHWRARIAPAMAKEFFKAHFFPENFPATQVFTNRLNYYLAAFFFNTFPLPQREAGARQTLRYIGEVTGAGYSVLIFPEGVRTDDGGIKPFRGGIGMIGSRLGLPVIPVRLEGVDRVLHTKWKMAKPGYVSVTFGAPMRLSGDNYADLARQVEQAVRDLPTAGPK